jgi:hypothetical protein
VAEDDRVIEYRRDDTGRFVTGTGGAGRKKGSRNRLNQHMLDLIEEDMNAHGEEALRLFRMSDPGGYWKMVFTTLQPKKVEALVEASVTIFDDFDLTDRLEFARAYQIAKRMIGAEDALVIDAEPVKEPVNE